MRVECFMELVYDSMTPARIVGVNDRHHKQGARFTSSRVRLVSGRGFKFP